MMITISKTLEKELKDADFFEAHSFLSGDPEEEKFWDLLSDITGHPTSWLRRRWSITGRVVTFIIVEDGEDYGTVLA